MQENLTEKVAKNSFFNLFSAILSKIGGFLFVIIIARVLTPELFGVYSIVLSISMFVLNLSNLGLNNTFVRYVSEAIGKKRFEKAKNYIGYLFKFRIFIASLMILIIVAFGKFISYAIFKKPIIHIPLLFACFYILFKSIEGILRSLFASLIDFSKITIMDFFLQFFRIVFVLVAVYIIKEKNIYLVSSVFIALSLAVLLSITIGIYLLKDKRNLLINRSLLGRSRLNAEDKKTIWKYLGLMSIFMLSFRFFGIIDTLILGAFLDLQYIGYYNLAFGLITSITAILGFGGTALFSVFTHIKKEKIKRGVDKSVRYTLILTIPAILGVLILGKYFIVALYGFKYAKAAYALYSASLLIIIYPLISIYTPLFEAKDKLNELVKFGIISLVLNIAIDFLAVYIFLPKSQLNVISLAAGATVISRGFYLIALAIKSRKIINDKINLSYFTKPLISSLIMALFLILLNHFIDMNIIVGIFEVLIGAVIYFIALYCINGIEREDFQLFWRVFAGIRG